MRYVHKSQYRKVYAVPPLQGAEGSGSAQSPQENTENIGKIFGKEDAVKEALAKIDEKVAKANKLAKEKGGKGLVVLTSDGLPH